ncbi:MAG: M28 family peptidase [Planctomycetota bacterium]
MPQNPHTLRRASFPPALWHIFFAVSLFVVWLGALSPGSAAGAQDSPPADSPATDSTGLARALDAVRPERLQADLYFLASDALRGRDTPSAELKVAALFLIARLQRLQRLGLEPAGREGWRYTFPLTWRQVVGERSGAHASSTQGSLDLAFGSQLFPERISHLHAWDVKGEIVSVGLGDEVDFLGLDVKGRWVLMMDRGRSLRRARTRAADAGAVGVIVTPGPQYARQPYAERYARTAGSMLRGLASNKLASGASGTSMIPVVMLPREGLARLEELSPAGWGAEWPGVGVELGIEFHDRRVTADPRIEVSNVCALLPGDDPLLSKEVILLTAHYDHVGARGDAIYNGADDNGSGTVGLLGVAEGLVAHGPFRRSVMLMWVAGEEKGLWGSKAWAQDPHLPAGHRVVCNVNIDMIGRNAPHELLITPTRAHAAFNTVAELVYDVSLREGFPYLGDQDGYWSRSDHAMFSEYLKVPVVFLSSGEHDDYHKPTDTPDKIDYDKIARVARTVLRLVAALQHDVLGEQAGPSVTQGRGAPIELAEARLFAARLATAAEDLDALIWRQVADPQALLARALEGAGEVSETERVWLAERGQLGELWQWVLGFAEEQGEVTVQAVELEEGDALLSLRLTSDTRFDYYRMRVARDTAGGLRVVDVHQFSEDCWLSERMAREHCAIAADPGCLEQGRTPAGLLPRERLTEMVDAGDLGLVAFLATLDESELRDPELLYTLLVAACDAGAQPWEAAYSANLAARPDSSVLPWAMLDLNVNEASTEDLARALDALQRLTGDASFVAYRRGLHAWYRDDNQLAREHLERAIELEPTFEDPYWTLLGVFQDLGDFRSFGELLDRVEQRLEVDMGPEEIEASGRFTEFVASDAYQAWKSGR